MLLIENEKYLDDTIAFAKQIGFYEPPPNGKNNDNGSHYLKSRLDYLNGYGGKNSDGTFAKSNRPTAPAQGSTRRRRARRAGAAIGACLTQNCRRAASCRRRGSQYTRGCPNAELCTPGCGL